MVFGFKEHVYMIKVRLFIFSSLIFMFLGCENKVEHGASKVHWDRDMCSRCVMVISDRKNTVQIQDPDTKKVYKFDDIGCMSIWFVDEDIKFKETADIWITDAQTGEWINAREAFYTTGNITPMAFGFSAYKSKTSVENSDEVIDYKEVLKRVKR